MLNACMIIMRRKKNPTPERCLNDYVPKGWPVDEVILAFTLFDAENHSDDFPFRLFLQSFPVLLILIM